MHLAKDIVSRLSPLVRRADFGVDWMQVNAGKSIYKQGSIADAVYIVLNGRCVSFLLLICFWSSPFSPIVHAWAIANELHRGCCELSAKWAVCC